MQSGWDNHSVVHSFIHQQILIEYLLYNRNHFDPDFIPMNKRDMHLVIMEFIVCWKNKF